MLIPVGVRVVVIPGVVMWLLNPAGLCGVGFVWLWVPVEVV